MDSNDSTTVTKVNRQRQSSIELQDFRRTPDLSSLYQLHQPRPISSWRFLSSASSKTEVIHREDFQNDNTDGTVNRDDFKGIDESEGKLGMIDGVFLRSLSNIMGIIMFIRLGFMVAYAGIFYSVMIVLIATSLTLATATSLSAICTNGQVKAGGAYFMISRALGPEFGGSIGMLLYSANAVSVALYCLGFAETLLNQMGSEFVFVDSEYDLRLIAALALIAAFVVCMIGVSWVVRMEKLLLMFLLIAVGLMVLGAWAGPKPRPDNYSVYSHDINSYKDRNNYLPGFQAGQFGENFWSQFEGPSPVILQDLGDNFFKNGDLGPTTTNSNITYAKPVCKKQPSEILKTEYGNVNFAVVFAVFFPAASGIMAGANVSGNLKDPSSSIPIGTILAISSASAIYILMICSIGAVGVRSILIKVYGEIPTADTIVAPLWECVFGGLFHEPLLPAKMAFALPVVYLGIYSATLSSALTALVSGPRILQAVASDNLFPLFTPLARTVGPAKEPIRAYVVTFFLAFLCIWTGDINTVAPLISTFFLSCYALVNYACYAAETSGSPGWRPSFQYYSKDISLFGAIGCVSTMLLLSAVTGFITFVIGLALYKYVEVSQKESKNIADWGPVRNARQFNIALTAAIRLEAMATTIPIADDKHFDRLGDLAENEDDSPLTKPKARAKRHALDSTHVKNFRPQCLVLCGPAGSRPGLCYLVNEFRKAKGVNVFADIMIGDVSDVKALEERNRRALLSYVVEYGLKGFGEVLLASSFRSAARSLIQLCGLGKMMRINTIVMGYLESWKDRSDSDKSNKVRAANEAEDSSSSDWDKYAPQISLEDYVGVISDAFDLGCGVAIIRGVHKLFEEDYFKKAAKRIQNELALRPPSERDHTPPPKSRLKMKHGHIKLDKLNSKEDEDNFDVSELAQDENDHENFHNTKWQELKGFAVKSVHEFFETPSGEMGERGLKPMPLNVESSFISGRIDVYWFVDDGGLTLMLPHLLRTASTPPFCGSQLRVIAVGGSRAEAEKELGAMEMLLKKLRIPSTVQVISLELASPTHAAGTNSQTTQLELIQMRYESIGRLITATSAGAILVACSMPIPHAQLNPTTYMSWLEALSHNAGSPVMLVQGAHREVLTALS